jgi:hypothetical protein
MDDPPDSASAPGEPVPFESPALPFPVEQAEDAIESSFQRGALPTSVRLSHALGTFLYSNPSPSLVKAHEYASFSYEASAECASDHHIQDLSFVLNQRLLLGKLCFYREEYDQAEGHLKFVLESSPSVPAKSRLAGDATWVLAHVQRARRDPPAAMTYCWAAVQAYESVDDTNARARLSTTVAEATLDVLEQRGGSQHFVDIAASHISTALTLAREYGDPSTFGMARLAEARFARVVRHSDESFWIIEEVLDDAVQRHDAGLLTQAYTSRGFDFAAHGLVGAAKLSFYDAIAASKESEALSLSGPARRALLMGGEFGVG